MSFRKENNALAESFFNRTFGRAWKTDDPKYDNFKSLEIDVNYRCNLNCKYCYVARYGEQLYPQVLYSDESKLLSNLSILLDWLIENQYRPHLEIFNGEPSVQGIFYKSVDMIIDKISPHYSTPIVVPTNYTFLLSEHYTAEMDRIIVKGEDCGMPIILSASVDGKYCESQRPFIGMVNPVGLTPNRNFIWEDTGGSDPRDNIFYNAVFDYAAKYRFGFHPMIYSENIQHWKKNFLWFQENFAKHGIPFDNIYLLEVRNMEWSTEQIRDFGSFTEFLIDFSWEKVGKTWDGYRNFITKGKGFNFLNSPLSRIGRGLGCSFQSTIQLRLGDLAIMPCHRTSYNHLIPARFSVENGRIVGLTANNPELWISSVSADANSFPYCEICTIRSICSKGCLGAQFETTGDMFTPIPSVCQLEHEKIVAMIRAYSKIGIYDKILGFISEEKRESFKIVEELK